MLCTSNLWKAARKMSVAACQNAYMDLAYQGVLVEVRRMNVPGVLHDLGYINPTHVKLHIPYDFVPPAAPSPQAKAQGNAKAYAQLVDNC